MTNARSYAIQIYETIGSSTGIYIDDPEFKTWFIHVVEIAFLLGRIDEILKRDIKLGEN